jgi:predicted ATPase
VGNPDQGIKLISEALAEIEESSEAFFEAEVYRIKGELLLIQDESDGQKAEESFRTAVDIARDQEAKFPELRSTMSLARILAKQGKRDEALAMLSDIYGWFTEGFDTADLKDAKALLEELGA